MGCDEEYNIISTRSESVEATTAWYKRVDVALRRGMGCGMIMCHECPMFVKEDEKCGVDVMRKTFDTLQGLRVANHTLRFSSGGI
ncbi:MAG: hypothetical protein M0R51_16090 [Clostridia bacterium]|nr:hypothetical protein [Clostridia bacterium]